MNSGHSGQGFKFDIPLILKLLSDINCGYKIKAELARENGLGDQKVDSYVEYLGKVDLITRNEQNEYLVTYFGSNILKLKNNYNFLEPLLLYKLARGEENGGHLYFSTLINFILYDIAFKIKNKTTIADIEKGFEIQFPNINYSKKFALLKQALNQGLCDNTTGFGKMGMVVNKDGLYEISGYIPHKLVTAYIFYDNWPKSRAALKLAELPTKDYFPAKIFFMGQDLLYEQIHYLVDDRILYLEQEAGLNQISLSPELDADKILDRIVEICISN